MKTLLEIVGATILVAVIIVVFSAIFSLPVWLLWNWLMPTIFGLTKITWIQSWGLMVLCGFLFKSSSTINTNNK